MDWTKKIDIFYIIVLSDPCPKNSGSIKKKLDQSKTNLDRSKIIFDLQKDQVLDQLKDWALIVVEGGPKIKEVF